MWPNVFMAGCCYIIIYHHFSQRDVTKCFPGGVFCLDFIALYVMKYNAITQKPQDHLFQNSKQHSIARKHTKHLKIWFISQRDSINCDSGGVGCTDWGTMGSHSSPMTIYLKIRGSVVLSVFLRNTTNLKKWFSWCYVTKCVPGWICCSDFIILYVL